jgi:NADPH-dependent glutamate synthase beta subunit-like oxidoreductase
VAIGAGKGVRLPIAGAECENVLENIDFLQKTALGNPPAIKGKVVVLGGGNVAFDCARTARRLGADSVTLICLESREAMPASPDEIKEGLEEGITIVNNASFSEIVSENSLAVGVKCREVAEFHLDENRRMQITLVEDSEYIIPAETIIFATGQRPEIPADFNLPVKSGNLLEVVDEVKAKESDVFVAGDVVYGTHSVIRAIASGRKAASAIDQALGGDGIIEEVLTTHEKPGAYLGRDESFLEKAREQVTHKDPASRVINFCAVSDCLSEASAVSESGRCLQCDMRVGITKPKFWASYKIK